MRPERDERTEPLEFFPNGIRGLQSILTPPEVRLADLVISKLADLDE